jgi:hypothetical protein
MFRVVMIRGATFSILALNTERAVSDSGDSVWKPREKNGRHGLLEIAFSNQLILLIKRAVMTLGILLAPLQMLVDPDFSVPRCQLAISEHVVRIAGFLSLLVPNLLVF